MLLTPSAGKGDKWPQRETQDAKLKETEATDAGVMFLVPHTCVK